MFSPHVLSKAAVVSPKPIQPEGNAVDRLRSRFESIKDTTADQALVEQLETMLEILDQPDASSAPARAHHPSARGRSRRAAKSKPDKLQAALSQLLVEQQHRQQIEQVCCAAQETVKQLIELVARRDKQLVSARHAWDLLKSRTRQAAEEFTDKISQLERTIERLEQVQRDLESQLRTAKLEKAELAEGVQALKAELHQLHRERFTTNGYIERLVAEQEAHCKNASQREQELLQAKDFELAKLRSGMQRATIMLESQRRQLAEAEHLLAEERAKADSRATPPADHDAH